jgi:hypothetical protein
MEINVHYTGDPGQASRATARLMRGRARVVRGLGALFVLLAIGGGAAGAPVPGVALVGACGALLIAVPGLAPWLVVRLRRKAIVVDVDVEVTDQGISRRTATHQVEARWEMVRKVIETSDFWLFIVDRRHFVALHKSVLTPAQRAEVAGFLARRPWEAAQLRPPA